MHSEVLFPFWYGGVTFCVALVAFLQLRRSCRQ